MKFLHIADVHLGCTRYQLSESPRDFYDAWIDVLEKYAVGERVDFVIMSGDFFDKKNVPPETMNYAVAGLSMLKENGIPVVTIEGNHDQKHTDSDYSWLRSLANWGLLHLLEPEMEDGTASYTPWDSETNRGGFVDIGGARLFGSHWYGASGNWAVPALAEAIAKNRRDGAFHVLLLHTDVEGHQTHPIPALTIESLKRLRAVTDYVALGHTHKSYEIDNWAFNPGSLEATSIDQFREVRGAFLVEIDGDGNVDARHVRDYRQRPFQRMTFDVSGYAMPDDIREALLESVSRQAHRAEEGELQPILEITLRGYLGFPNAELNIRAIRDEAQELTGALHVRIKNHSAPLEYKLADGADEEIGKDQLERKVIEDLVVRDSRYKTRIDEVSDAVVGAKRMALNDEPAEKILDFLLLNSESASAD
ncbi:MAG: exonuclease SbcCD subunit D [Acidobacteriota bacterium]